MNSKWVSPHLKNHPANQKEQSQPKDEGKPAMHSKEGAMHGDEQTQAHPMTGIHKVEMEHHGGGMFKSKTHHEGGQVEDGEHHGEEAMQQHMKNSFPNENEGSQGEPMPDDGMSDMPLSSLGE